VDARLIEVSLPENKYYFYHHFDDNCTTRVRDLVDEVSGGALSAAGGARYAHTLREQMRQGFAPSLPVLALSEILIGRSVDRRPPVWEAMYHPDVLREEITRVFGVAPEIVYARERPVPSPNPRNGVLVLLAFAVALGGMCAAAELWGRRWARRAAIGLAGIVTGLLSTLILVLALATPYAELRQNELMFVFLPTDFALVALSERWRRMYLTARLAMAGVAAVLALAGVLHQPLLAPLALVVLPAGAAVGIPWLRARQARAVVPARV
jgi:hypothetical protein